MRPVGREIATPAYTEPIGGSRAPRRIATISMTTAREQQRQVEAEPPPDGQPGGAHLLAFLAHLAAHRAAGRDVERDRGDRQPHARRDDRGRRERVDDASRSDLRAQDDHRGGEAEHDTDDRADACDHDRLREGDRAQVAAVRPPDPKGRVLAALGRGQDAARVRGEERRQQGAREAQEEEHPSAGGRVVARDRNVLEMLSIRYPCPGPIWSIARAIAVVCSRAVAGSARRRARSTSTSTSSVGKLLVTMPTVARSRPNAGMISLRNTSGETTTEFGT